MCSGYVAAVSYMRSRCGTKHRQMPVEFQVDMWWMLARCVIDVCRMFGAYFTALLSIFLAYFADMWWIRYVCVENVCRMCVYGGGCEYCAVLVWRICGACVLDVRGTLIGYVVDVW